MSLRIVPRQSRPFDLAVRWDFKPAASQTLIEVQEPKLEMQIDGPREVFYGKKETYRLKITNTGTGNAEGVAIKFVPVGAGDNVQAMYDLGLLPAGEDKLIEVELTARNQECSKSKSRPRATRAYTRNWPRRCLSARQEWKSPWMGQSCNSWALRRLISCVLRIPATRRPKI